MTDLYHTAYSQGIERCTQQNQIVIMSVWRGSFHQDREEK